MMNVLAAALIVGSAVSVPLFMVFGLTFTGDRIIGALAGVFVAVEAIRGRIRWTPIHGALALFVFVQLVTTLLNAHRWPRGLLLVTVYLLGFACFVATTRVASRPETRRVALEVLVATGAVVGLVGSLLTAAANLMSVDVWGAVRIPVMTAAGSPVFAAHATFVEPNFLGSFLLVPLALQLWAFRGERGRPSLDSASGHWLPGIVAGIVFSYTRAAWIGMAGIVAVWARRPRPSRPTRAGLLGMIALVFVLQIITTGLGPFLQRTVMPFLGSRDTTVAPRLRISTVMLRSWWERPLVGHGAGAGSQLTLVVDGHRTVHGLWAGNLEVHLLQNSGLLGLAAFLLVVAIVWREARRATSARRQVVGTRDREEDIGDRRRPLLLAGVFLLFAFQFTHGLWVMYPYVYLGLLTAELEAGDEAR